jgi:hypothetical protein
MQGPITVFEGSSYAGDARILDLQPNEERLISYAIDLGTEVKPEPSQDSGRIVSVKAVKGVLHTTNVQRQGKLYTVKNRNEAERALLVEHPVNSAFKLVSKDRPQETASDVYRFQIKVPPGETKVLTVTEERQFGETIAVNSRGDDQLRFFISQPFASASLKKGLTRAMELRWAVEKTRRETREQERQLNIIKEDQGRLRANIREMPSTSKAYKRYVDKFDSQETQIEQFQATIRGLHAQEHTEQKALDDFLASFSTE